MQAGALDNALDLLAAAESGPLDEFASARADLLRGHVAFAASRGSDAPLLLTTDGPAAAAPALRRVAR